MKPETEKKLNCLLDLIEALPADYALLKEHAKDTVESVNTEIYELNGDLEDAEEELAISKSEVDELQDKVVSIEMELRECRTLCRETEEELEQLEDSTGEQPQNLHDELRNNVCRRLYNNLSLEQLENVEHNVKQGFKNVNREYILELN